MLVRLVLAMIVLAWLVLQVLSTGLDKLILGTELNLGDNAIFNSVATFSLGVLVALVVPTRRSTPKDGSPE